MCVLLRKYQLWKVPLRSSWKVRLQKSPRKSEKFLWDRPEKFPYKSSLWKIPPEKFSRNSSPAKIPPEKFYSGETFQG